MNPLRRILTLLLALAPLVAQADACTVGAVAGRPDMACGMEAPRPVVAAGEQSCPYCHDQAPQPAPARTRAGTPTCCDLKPQATADASLTMPVSPAGFGPAALLPVAPAPEAPAVAAPRTAPDIGRAPPGGLSATLPSRAPPLG